MYIRLFIFCMYFPVEEDWNELVPETQRLDTSAQKSKCRLAQKSKRQAPSRIKLKENLGSHSKVCAEQLVLSDLTSIQEKSGFSCIYAQHARLKCLLLKST